MYLCLDAEILSSFVMFTLLKSISWCLQMVGGSVQMVKPHFGLFTFYFILPFVSPMNLYIYAAGSVMFCSSWLFFGGALHLNSHAFAVWICKLP